MATQSGEAGVSSPNPSNYRNSNQHQHCLKMAFLHKTARHSSLYCGAEIVSPFDPTEPLDSPRRTTGPTRKRQPQKATESAERAQSADWRTMSHETLAGFQSRVPEEPRTPKGARGEERRLDTLKRLELQERRPRPKPIATTPAAPHQHHQSLTLAPRP